MKFILRAFTFLLLGVFALLCACDSSSSQIGSDFFNSGSLDISSIDSVSVKLSTIRFDSLVTSDGSRILAGAHTDDKLGAIQTTAYFLPSRSNEIPDKSTASFSRLSVLLRYDGYFYYDTTTTLKLYVYQLQDELELRDDGKLYNSTGPELEPDPIGSLTFAPSPHRDSIEITLDNDFAEDFFLKATTGAVEFDGAEDFRKFIKGLAIVPGTESACILGFSVDAELRLLYMDRSVVPSEEKYISYPATSGFTFTAVSVDRTSSKLPLEMDGKSKVDAAETDDEAYLQAGEGLATRIDLPSLRELKQFENFYATKAVLRIQPVNKSFGKFTPLPEGLDVYVINSKNELVGQYTSGATLVPDLTTGRDTWYELDATAFVKSQMDRDELNEDALLLVLPDVDFRSGADRICFSRPGYLKETRLIIYYATILNQ